LNQVLRSAFRAIETAASSARGRDLAFIPDQPTTAGEAQLGVVTGQASQGTSAEASAMRGGRLPRRRRAKGRDGRCKIACWMARVVHDASTSDSGCGATVSPFGTDHITCLSSSTSTTGRIAILEAAERNPRPGFFEQRITAAAQGPGARTGGCNPLRTRALLEGRGD